MKVGLFVVAMLGMGASSAWAGDVYVLSQKQGTVYQAIYVNQAQAEYPYPIKTDRINQMMGKRLAVVKGYQEFLKELPLLMAYINDPYKPDVEDDGFVKGATVGNVQWGEKAVTVDVEFVFMLSDSSLERLKQEQGRTFNVVMTSDLSRVREADLRKYYEITPEYWTKLKDFARHMSEE